MAEGRVTDHPPSRIGVQNGWLVCDGRPLIGLGHACDSWGGLRKSHTPPAWIKPFREWVFELQPRVNICRNWPRKTGPGLTEDLEQAAEALNRLGFTAYEHYYGLWYDRRRDMHDPKEKRPPEMDDPANPWDNPVPPFFEQPWARSGQGLAYDGKTLYDLKNYNAWYFDRLETFAGYCAARGMLFLHGHHNQHTILENSAHYADYAWNPANCLQNLPMPPLPETVCVCAAQAFYDVSDPTKRQHHRHYIRHCLDELSDCSNVMHKHGAEYTGPLSFTQFWLDTIAEWKAETGRDALVCLCATKDVTDAVLADENRCVHVDAVDLRGWWYQAGGSLMAPLGGQEDQPGRYQGEIAQTTAFQLYRQVREYRMACPDKAIIHSINSGDIAKLWALLAGGASVNIAELDALTDGMSYAEITGGESFAYTAMFIRQRVGPALIHMLPAPELVNRPDENWCLADAENQEYLVYSSAGGDLLLETPKASDVCWFDPITGDLRDAGPPPWTAPGKGWVLQVTGS